MKSMSRHEGRGSGRSTAAVVAAALALAGCAGAPAANTPTSAPSAAVALTPTPTTATATATPASLPADYCAGGSYVPSPAESTAVASGSVVRKISVGTDAFDVAFADGSIWVAAALDGYVKRIDPKTNKVTATFELGAKTEDSYLLQQGSHMWFTRWGQGSPPVVGWIDMDTNEVGGTYPVDPVPLGMTLERDSLWVTAFDTQSVIELNSKTGAVRRSIVVDPDRSAPPEAGPTDVVAVDSSLWIVGHRGSALIRVDTATGDATDRI